VRFLRQPTKQSGTTIQFWTASPRWPVLPRPSRTAERAEYVRGELVSGNFFETLGVSAVIGRVLVPEDDRRPDSPPVCVLSYGLWQQRFGADRNVIGHQILISGRPFTVLGVTPKGFTGFAEGTQTDLFIPRKAVGMSQFANLLRTFGRLKPGVSVAEAQASLDAVVVNSRLVPPGGHVKIILEPGSRGFVQLVNQYERPLRMLMVVVALVLLIACANISNLLMARASNRAKEIAVRIAVGAGRARLVRQLLLESLLLTAGGAALGMALAYWMDHALLVLAPRQIGGRPLIVDAGTDWRVLLFTLAATAVVSALSGIRPAIKSTHPDLLPALKGEAGGRVPGRLSVTNALVFRSTPWRRRLSAFTSAPSGSSQTSARPGSSPASFVRSFGRPLQLGHASFYILDLDCLGCLS